MFKDLSFGMLFHWILHAWFFLNGKKKSMCQIISCVLSFSQHIHYKYFEMVQFYL